MMVMRFMVMMVMMVGSKGIHKGTLNTPKV